MRAITTRSGACPRPTTGPCSRSWCWRASSPGLSWLTILKKRENFRKAFHGFDAARIARYGAKDIARLMADAGHRAQQAQGGGHHRQRPGAPEAAGAHEPRGLSVGLPRRPPADQHAPLASRPCRPRRPPPRPFPRRSRRRASASSGPPRSMPSCRPPAWSTTTSSSCHATSRAPSCREASRLPERLERMTREAEQRRQTPAPRRRAPGSACFPAAGSTCSIPRRPTSRSRTSRTGSPASRAGTARRSAITPSRSPSMRCSSRRSSPPAARHPSAAGGSRRCCTMRPEYVIGDLISPFKAAVGLDYKAFEVQLLQAIHRRFGLPPALPEPVTAAHQARRPHRRLLRGHRARRLRHGGGRPLLRRAQRPAARCSKRWKSLEPLAGGGGASRVSRPLSRACRELRTLSLFRHAVA